MSGAEGESSADLLRLYFLNDRIVRRLSVFMIPMRDTYRCADMWHLSVRRYVTPIDAPIYDTYQCADMW